MSLNFWKNWEDSEKVSVAATIFSAAVSGTFAFLIPTILPIQAIASGAFGGILHEFAQSGGKIFFLQKHEDGLDLGSLAGVVLGGVAGVIVLQGYLPAPQVCVVNTPEVVEGCEASKKRSANSGLLLEMFLAGLALKGVSQAAASSEKAPPVNTLKLSNPQKLSVNDILNVNVEALDSNGKTVEAYRGTISFRVSPEITDITVPPDRTFKEQDKGTAVVDFIFRKPGKYTIIATDVTQNISTQSSIEITT